MGDMARFRIFGVLDHPHEPKKKFTKKKTTPVPVLILERGVMAILSGRSILTWFLHGNDQI
jgi:hypothetical protein